MSHKARIKKFPEYRFTRSWQLKILNETGLPVVLWTGDYGYTLNYKWFWTEAGAMNWARRKIIGLNNEMVKEYTLEEL